MMVHEKALKGKSGSRRMYFDGAASLFLSAAGGLIDLFSIKGHSPGLTGFVIEIRSPFAFVP